MVGGFIWLVAVVVVVFGNDGGWSLVAMVVRDSGQGWLAAVVFAMVVRGSGQQWRLVVGSGSGSGWRKQMLLVGSSGGRRRVAVVGGRP